MNAIRVDIVAGTRPEGIKLAPLVNRLRREPERFLVRFVSTGQHRQMLAQVLEMFNVAPDVDLGLMKPGQELTDITCGVLLGLRQAFRERRPDWVIVQGDTTTALAGALAAFYEKIRVAHVEAGLRTGDKFAPYPEETNRRLADVLADLYLAPTDRARDALLAEGFPAARIHVTGNTVVDAVLAAREVVRARGIGIPGVTPALLSGRRMLLVTGHRRESFGDTFEGMCRAMLRIVEEQPDLVLVYPVHLNPNVEAPVRRILGGHDRIRLLPPLGYLQFIAAMESAHLILTDSGGVQEEGPSFGKPILVMRDVTERPEGIEAGVAELVGTSEAGIHAGVTRLLSDPEAYAAMATGRNPYGDGQASDRIARLLARRSE